MTPVKTLTDKMTTEFVRGENLGKVYEGTIALQDVSLTLQPGERVCVWGPSGAGKSTLLHVLGLLTPPSKGTLTLFGHSVANLSSREQALMRNEKMGFLFQFHHLLPDLTLLENVIMPLLIRRQPPEEVRPKAETLLRRLGLGARLSHRPSEASGGEQQRAALARALVGDPVLILADEPTGNLDQAHSRDVAALLREETRQRGASLVLVTHDENLAAQMDRRLVIVDGRLQS